MSASEPILAELAAIAATLPLLTPPAPRPVGAASRWALAARLSASPEALRALPAGTAWPLAARVRYD